MTRRNPFIDETGEIVAVTTDGRWLAYLALGATALLTILTCFHRVWATDIWWQFKAGEYINNHGWPTVDVFSYALVDEPWVELRWLFCMTQYYLMENFGPTSLIVAKCLAVMAAFALVSLPVLRRENAVLVGFTVSAAVMAASVRFLVRPEIVSWLFAAVFVYVLSRHRREDTLLIWMLPLLQVVWVNSHTLFIFGPLLVGLALFVTVLGPLAGWIGLATIGSFAVAEGFGLRGAGLAALIVAVVGLILWGVWHTRERLSHTGIRRRWIPLVVVGVAGVLACLVNPWGVDGFMVPFDQFLQISNSIYAGALTEYQSPFSYGLRLTSVVWYELLIGLVVISALLNLRRLGAFWLLFCASQLYLSTIAVRNLPLFCLAAVPFIVSNFSRSTILENLSNKSLRWGRRATAAATVAMLLWYGVSITTDRYSLRQRDSNQFGIGFADQRYPVGAMDFLDRNRVNGRVFATMLQAAYVLAHDRRVFADPRGDVYPDAKLAEFLRAQSDPGAWNAAVERYDIRVAVLDLRSGLISVLGRVGGWPLVYFDGVSAVFVRGDALGALDPIDTDEEFRAVQVGLRDVLPAPKPYSDLGQFERATIPNPYLALADFLYVMRRPLNAGVWLDDAEAASPYLDHIPHRRVALAELTQDWPAVIENGLVAIEETPDDPRVQFSVGAAYFRQGQFDEAKRYVANAVGIQPRDATSWSILGEIAAREQQFDVASRHFEKAVEFAPGNAHYHGSLARARMMTGDQQGAFDELKQALKLDPKNIGALHDMAQLYIANGDAPSARAVHERAWLLAPNHPMLRQQRQALEALEERGGPDGSR